MNVRALLVVALLLTLLTGSANAGEIVHVVRKGQNLGMIAKRYHTTAEAIRKRNKLEQKQLLRVGQKLRIVESADERRWREYLANKNKTKKNERTTRSKTRSRRAKASADRQKKATSKEAKRSKRKASKRKPSKRKPSKAKASKRKPSKRKPSNKWARNGHKRGYVRVVRGGEKFVGRLVSTSGKVVAKASKRLDRLLRSRRTGKRSKMNRRLLKLLAKTSDQFGGRTIIVISGYRPYSPKQHTPKSRHNHGRAIDFRVVGVPNRDLFEFCRKQRKVGCGYYPHSSFIHMDVRQRKTQWTDYSRPGQAPIYAHKRRRKGAKPNAAGGHRDKATKTVPAKTGSPKTTSPKPRETGAKLDSRQKS